MNRLYQRKGAGRPPRVRWALEEAGASYDYVVVAADDPGIDDLRARHPLGRVPVLEGDDGALFESAALCLHVADLYPAAELIPVAGSHARGEVYQWCFFAMTELEAAMLRAWAARDAAEPDAGKLARAQERLLKAGTVVADALDGHDYLVGDAFTIADVVVGGVLDSARKYHLFPDVPALREYLERLDAREAKQRAYAA
jgi:glutathione S-transferase